MERMLVTGASGFVGSAILRRLLQERRYRPIGANRGVQSCVDGAEAVSVGDVGPKTNWAEAFRAGSGAAPVSVVIHAAARVHMMHETASDPLAEFRRINVEGSLNLARQASASGVRRFIFVSSVKVNGEGTVLGEPFTADDHPHPCDPYGISKLEAERGLLLLAAETGMEVVIIRPPLVYGPGVKANFLAMMRWLSRGVPLPFGSVTGNRRSLVALDNLVDLIVTCIDHPAAANQTFLVSDGEDLSTANLLRRMGQALGTPARLIPVPVGLLHLGTTMLGRPGLAQRLCGSLQVDITKTRKLLGWSPPVSVDEGLRRTALHWLDTQGRSRG